MKKLRLFFMSFSQNIISSIIITVILTSVLLFGQDIIGQYRYIVYSKDIMDNQYISNSDYFMIDVENYMEHENIDDWYQNTGYSASINKKISKFDGVRGIVDNWNGAIKYKDYKSYISAELYTDEMADAFSKLLSEGCWFKDAEASDIPNVILSGPIFNDISVGDDITVKLVDSNKDSKIPQRVHVIGKYDFPWFSPFFTVGGDKVSTSDFFGQKNTVIFDRNDKKIMKLQEKHRLFASQEMFYFVMYDENCTEEQKQEVRDYMNTVGTYSTYDDLIEDTNSEIRYLLLKKLIMPLFLLFVATVMLISISTLSTYKKLRDHSIYYLCGCSRKRSFLYLAAEISISVIIALAVSLVYVIIMMQKIRNCTLGYDCFIIDYYNILISLGYAVITLAVTLIIPYAVYKKNTPIEIYRRNHND